MSERDLRRGECERTYRSPVLLQQWSLVAKPLLFFQPQANLTRLHIYTFFFSPYLAILLLLLILFFQLVRLLLQ